MIEEVYVNLETARLAKKKGFNEPYSFVYTKIDSKIRFYELENGPLRNLDLERYAEAISAPTQAILLRWLREKYNLFICIHYLSKEKFFSPFILDMINRTYRFTNTKHDTYEEAAEGGLEVALKSI